MCCTLRDSVLFFLTRSIAATLVLTTRTMKWPAGGGQIRWRLDRFSQFVSVWLNCNLLFLRYVASLELNIFHLFGRSERAGSVDHFDIVERVEMGQMASMFFNKGKNNFMLHYVATCFTSWNRGSEQCFIYQCSVFKYQSLCLILPLNTQMSDTWLHVLGTWFCF